MNFGYAHGGFEVVRHENETIGLGLTGCITATKSSVRPHYGGITGEIDCIVQQKDGKDAFYDETRPERFGDPVW
jgi:methylthioribose-1-phosphate isomerase